MQIRDGLTEWHLEHARGLMQSVLVKNRLCFNLGKAFGIDERQLFEALESLCVIRTMSGRSFHQSGPSPAGGAGDRPQAWAAPEATSSESRSAESTATPSASYAGADWCTQEVLDGAEDAPEDAPDNGPGRAPNRRKPPRSKKPSAGGVIHINFGGLEQFENGGEYPEYASYAADEVIGSRYVQNEDEYLIMSCGHELAHFVVGLMHRRSEIRPHGAEFREVYRLIREQAINPMLDEFAQSAAERAADAFNARLRTKLAALRKMAEDASSNEHEAERAMHQMQALMKKYGIDAINEAEPSATRFIERQVPVLSEGAYKPLQHLFGDIGTFCGCEAVITTHQIRVRRGVGTSASGTRKVVKYFGAPEDVEMAIYLSRILVSALFRETENYRGSQDYAAERAAGVAPRTLIFAFRRAFVDRMNTRLRMARRDIEADWCSHDASTTALVTDRKAALRKSFEARYPRLGSLSLSSSGSQNAAAEGAGRSAANRVNLSRPLGVRGLLKLKG